MEEKLPVYDPKETKRESFLPSTFPKVVTSGKNVEMELYYGYQCHGTFQCLLKNPSRLFERRRKSPILSQEMRKEAIPSNS